MSDFPNRSNNQKLDINGVYASVRNAQGHPRLNAFCSRYALFDDGENVELDVVIEAKQTGLHCTWFSVSNGPLHFYIDVDKFVKQQFSYPAAKQGAFNQALGKKTKTILDATGGWGSDALLMCTQGFTVTLLERNPIMAILLDDAMLRLASTSWAIDNQVISPEVFNIDAIEFLNNNEIIFDCVYLDPMYPPKRKKTAAVNKNIQFLQWLVGEDLDANKLAKNALSTNCSRVVVKRPSNAQPLLSEISVKFSSKLVNYDVYLKS